MRTPMSRTDHRGRGLRAAIERLADDWESRGEDSDSTLTQFGGYLRAVLAAHPATPVDGHFAEGRGAGNDAGLHYPWVVSGDGGSWAITSTNGDVIASEIPHGVVADYIADLHHARALPPVVSLPEAAVVEHEALTDALGDIRVDDGRQMDWWTSDEDHALLIRVLRGECAPWAEGLLASDWLRGHDAKVRRDTAERIAQAIEAQRAELPWPGGTKEGVALAAAIRSAREEGYPSP